MRESGTAFPCTSAAVQPKTDAFACGAAAITVWTHPLNGSVALGLFSEGEAADIELEVWAMGGIL